MSAIVFIRDKRYRMVNRDETGELLINMRFLLRGILELEDSLTCRPLSIEVTRVENLREEGCNDAEQDFCEGISLLVMEDLYVGLVGEK